MKYTIAILFILCSSCSGGSSGSSGSSTPTPSPTPTGEKNISLDEAYILPGNIYNDAELYQIRTFFITVTNHSRSEPLYFDVCLTDNGSDLVSKTGTLDPEESREVMIDLYQWLGNKPGTHYLEITVDWADVVGETDETDNNVEQTIFIIEPVGG